jgi:glucose/arabinose dehydrogenase
MVKVFSIAMATLVLLAGGTVVAASLDASNGQPLKGEAAFGGWRQDKPGERRLLTPQDLPPIGKSTASRSEVVPMPSGAKPEVPAGFSVELVASGIASPRAIRMAPNGDLFVADSAANAVRVFRIPAGSAKPARTEVFANDLYRPFGIAFYPLGSDPQWVYVANSDGVVRFPYKNGDLTATGKAEKIVERIPWVHHWTRDIVFSPDGKRLLLTVGACHGERRTAARLSRN